MVQEKTIRNFFLATLQKKNEALRKELENKKIKMDENLDKTRIHEISCSRYN